MLREVPKPRDLWTDQEFIKAHGEALQAARSPKPYFLGKLERPGWTGRIPTYLIYCRACQYIDADGGFTVAHEAGYERRLECKHCRTRYDHLLPGRRAKDTMLNPHRHPWFIAFLFLAAFILALALR